MSAEFHPAVARWFARTFAAPTPAQRAAWPVDRKSTRLNSSHSQISYAVFCLKKKNQIAVRHSRRLPPDLRNYSLQGPRLADLDDEWMLVDGLAPTDPTSGCSFAAEPASLTLI